MNLFIIVITSKKYKNIQYSIKINIIAFLTEIVS